MKIERRKVTITLDNEEAKAVRIVRDILDNIFDEMDQMGLNCSTLYADGNGYDSDIVESAKLLCADLSICVDPIVIEVE